MSASVFFLNILRPLDPPCLVNRHSCRYTIKKVTRKKTNTFINNNVKSLLKLVCAFTICTFLLSWSENTHLVTACCPWGLHLTNKQGQVLLPLEYFRPVPSPSVVTALALTHHFWDGFLQQPPSWPSYLQSYLLVCTVQLRARRCIEGQFWPRFSKLSPLWRSAAPQYDTQGAGSCLLFPPLLHGTDFLCVTRGLMFPHLFTPAPRCHFQQKPSLNH